MQRRVVSVVVIALLAAGLWFAVSTRALPSARIPGAHISVVPLEHDFGIIRQSGGSVSAAFTVQNTGTEDIVISGTPASCSCTSAVVDRRTLKAGESAVLTVTFDPNYHFEDSGRFFRTVAVQSNAEGAAPEAKIWVEVTYDLGKDKLKFPPAQD